MHISPSNKKYIGITKQKVNKRWKNGNGYKTQQYFYRAIEKYGWDNFQHIIIAKGLTKDIFENLWNFVLAKWVYIAYYNTWVSTLTFGVLTHVKC